MSHADIPLVPVSYAARLAALLAPRGIAPEPLLAHTGVTRAMFDDASARMSFRATSRMFENALALTGDPSFGLELGLALKASSHGVFGMALLTCESLGDAIQLGGRYMDLTGSPWRIQLATEGDTSIMRFVEVVALPMRAVMLEAVLGAVIRVGEFMLGESFAEAAQPAIEFWIDVPEPPHHARFRDQVPRVRYQAPNVQALFPTAWLARPLALREPVANREALTALEQQRRIADPGDDLVARTRALLASPEHRYPGLEQIASQLSVSARTLRRHLGQHGVVFNELRDEARRARAFVLLDQSTLTIADVAIELGFSDAAGFARAFQRWCGESPSSYRKRKQL